MKRRKMADLTCRQIPVPDADSNPTEGSDAWFVAQALKYLGKEGVFTAARIWDDVVLTQWDNYQNAWSYTSQLLASPGMGIQGIKVGSPIVYIIDPTRKSAAVYRRKK
jgi:hypothetical protein